MADEAAVTLGTTPEAIAQRQREVVLADGSKVVVYKWSNQKYPVLLPMVADLKRVGDVAAQSVGEKDRERVAALEYDDQIEIANTAIELNVTERTLKNFNRFLGNAARLVEAVKKSAQ